jgi:HK97 family phage major capsid protein
MFSSTRRIITRGVIDMATSAILESEGFDYAGPMAFCDEADDDLALLTKSITEISELAKANGISVTKQLAAIDEHTKKTDARLLDTEQKLAALKNGRGSGGGTGAGGTLRLGAMVAADPRMEQLRKGEISQARISQRASLSMLCKSILVETGTSGASPEDGFPAPTEFLASVPRNAPGRRLQVLQALPHLSVSMGTAIMPELTSSSDGSAVQEFQGGAKGETTLAVHPQSLPMATVATFLNASRQLLDDVATLPSFLQTWLAYFAMRKFENLIVSGSGDAADGKITGLLNGGTAYTSGQTYNADKVGDAAFTQLPSYGYAADLIILNSSDYFNIISQRATTEQYVGGGWGAPNPGTLWGIRAVATPGLAAGHAIVCDTQLISILDRQEITFLIGTTGSQFTENLFTYLAELRGQLAIGDPHAVSVVALA